MSDDFTIEFSVDQTPAEVFAAITNVRGWWSEGVEGGTEQLGDRFVYRHGDIHSTLMELVDVVPDQRVEWQCLEAFLNFTADPEEWTGTKVRFEVAANGAGTDFRFTHVGLSPDVECFDVCSNAWAFYIGSLRSLIATGQGRPDRAEVATGS
jgi:uncharacterized protein YndB with AHSA1/START domain